MVLGRGHTIPETVEEYQRVSIELPNKWRIDGSERSDLSDGVGRWFGVGDHITYNDEEGPSLHDTELGLVIYPGDFLAGFLRFDDPVEEEVAARPCWKVDARPSRGSERMHSPGLMRLGGTDNTLWFDAETGIVLRRVSTVDGQPCWVEEFGDIVANQPIDPDTFRFVAPPGARVERPFEGFVRLAEERGADFSGVDRNDSAALRKAVHEVLNPSQPSPANLRESRRAKHVPLGPPPSVPDEAYRQIQHAFARHDETAPGSDTLINVQSGENLAPLLERARLRLPKSDPESVTMVVDEVVFLRDDEAVVWFSIDVDGERFGFVNGREGRAVRVGGRWLMERATLVDLLGLAGVPYPPS
jgi:hypothetical protein